MGVHGLTTFLRERRSALSKTIQFSTQYVQVTPLVVDGWSFIYKLLEDSGLPWVYGGEYDAFVALIIKTVKAWIGVGLRPIFVFDGPSPPGKFTTLVQRRNQNHVQHALLFFRTSSASRNTRRFLNEARIIPPLVLSVCVYALLSLQNSMEEKFFNAKDGGGFEEESSVEVHFADEEADPYAVELAGRLRAYVTGRDSDFVVLNSDGYLGYIPLEEMLWIATDINAEQTVSEEADDGFQSVKKKKRTAPERVTTSGIIPPDSAEFSLSASLYTPASLAQHLNLPVSLLPLLGALVGNDYTLVAPDRSSSAANFKGYQSPLFDRRLSSSQRITHTSTTLNSFLHGNHIKKKQKKPRSVMELIEMTVGSLLLSSGAPTTIVGPDQQAAIVERMVVGTLPYAMPLRPAEDAFLSITVCALHFPYECQLVATMDRAGMEGSSTYSETVSALYLRAYRLGKFSPPLMNIFSTRTFWPTIFLESPDVETASRSVSRGVRQFIYALLEDGVAIPAPPVDDENEDPQEEELDIEIEDPDELVDVVEDPDEDSDYEDNISDDVGKLRGALRELQFEEDEEVNAAGFANKESYTEVDSVKGSIAPSSSARSPAPLHRPAYVKKSVNSVHKVVTEYIRRGARVVAEGVEVNALHQFCDASAPVEEGAETFPIQLRSETERIEVLCQFLRVNPQDILNLSREDRMLVLSLRLVIHRMHARAEEAANSKEKQLGRWTRKEARAFLSSVTSSAAELSIGLDPPFEISERSVQLTAQISTAVECIEHVVQVLLLTDTIPGCMHRFSGYRFHSLLASSELAHLPENLWHAFASGLDACFAEERQGKKAKRKEQKAVRSANATSTPNGRSKLNASGSIYSLLADM